MKIKVNENTVWNAGEIAMFTIANKIIKGSQSRTSSLSSLPSDGHILIGFRTGKTPSPFKVFLINEGISQEVKIRGPFGAFRFREDTRPVVLFASGVGITPIHVLVKDVTNHQGQKINVVHASSSVYMFKGTIDAIVKEHTNINVTYTKGKEDSEAALVKLAKELGNEGYYYNSGAPSVIKSVRSLLKKQGIKNNNLINDAFMGY